MRPGRSEYNRILKIGDERQSGEWGCGGVRNSRSLMSGVVCGCILSRATACSCPLAGLLADYSAVLGELSGVAAESDPTSPGEESGAGPVGPDVGAATSSGVSATNEVRPVAGAKLVQELTGDLECVACRYNLRGLTIRGVCPECRTTVRTTLLAKVDPQAKELQPIRFPRLTASGMIAWSGGALAAAMCVWGLRIGELMGLSRGVSETWGDTQLVLRWGIVVFAVLSGLGAIAFIRPHGGLPRLYSLLAFLGVLMYIPLALLAHRLHLGLDLMRPPPYGPGAAVYLDRTLLRLCIGIFIGVALVCVRLNARQLAARWLLMRVGAVDRQTILVLVTVIGLSCLGDGLLLLADVFHGGADDIIRLIGGVIIQLGSVLFTIGLAGLTFDSIRLWDVVARKPLALEDVVSARG
jgi:hypothetical protein